MDIAVGKRRNRIFPLYVCSGLQRRWDARSAGVPAAMFSSLPDQLSPHRSRWFSPPPDPLATAKITKLVLTRRLGLAGSEKVERLSRQRVFAEKTDFLRTSFRGGHVRRCEAVAAATSRPSRDQRWRGPCTPVSRGPNDSQSLESSQFASTPNRWRTHESGRLNYVKNGHELTLPVPSFKPPRLVAAHSLAVVLAHWLLSAKRRLPTTRGLTLWPHTSFEFCIFSSADEHVDFLS